MEMRIRGDRLGTERAFHVNGINKGSHGYAQETNIFHGYRASNKHFPWISLDYKSECAENTDSVIIQ
jgi:hypothetical protein